MKNPIENVDSVEVIDSNTIDAIKTIRHCNKKRPDENTIVDYSCKSYPDCNVTTICQRITCLENKNKILNKLHNGKHSYYLIDDSAIIPDDSVSLKDQQSISLFDVETPRVNPIKKTGYSSSRPKRKTPFSIYPNKYVKIICIRANFCNEENYTGDTRTS